LSSVDLGNKGIDFGDKGTELKDPHFGQALLNAQEFEDFFPQGTAKGKENKASTDREKARDKPEWWAKTFEGSRYR